jgi:hypothetical protein
MQYAFYKARWATGKLCTGVEKRKYLAPSEVQTPKRHARGESVPTALSGTHRFCYFIVDKYTTPYIAQIAKNGHSVLLNYIF